MKKNKKHQEILNDYDGIKSRHLEKLANQMLKTDKKNQQLRKKTISNKFFDEF